MQNITPLFINSLIDKAKNFEKRLSKKNSRQINTDDYLLWAHQGLNLGLPDYESGALTN